jgi:hypothetical protein
MFTSMFTLSILIAGKVLQKNVWINIAIDVRRTQHSHVSFKLITTTASVFARGWTGLKQPLPQSKNNIYVISPQN